jgi:hypothetical protein
LIGTRDWQTVVLTQRRQPDSSEKALRPGGWWVVAAIDADLERTLAREFGEARIAEPCSPSNSATRCIETRVKQSSQAIWGPSSGVRIRRRCARLVCLARRSSSRVSDPERDTDETNVRKHARSASWPAEGVQGEVEGGPRDSSASLARVGSTATSGAWPSPTIAASGCLGVQDGDHGPLPAVSENGRFAGEMPQGPASVPFGGSDGLGGCRLTRTRTPTCQWTCQSRKNPCARRTAMLEKRPICRIFI